MWVEGQENIWAKSSHVIQAPRQSRRRLEFFCSPRLLDHRLSDYILFPNSKSRVNQNYYKAQPTS